MFEEGTDFAGEEKWGGIFGDDIAIKVVFAVGIIDAGVAADGEGILGIGGGEEELLGERDEEEERGELGESGEGDHEGESEEGEGGDEVAWSCGEAGMVAVEGSIDEEEPGADGDTEEGFGGEDIFAEPDEPTEEAEEKDWGKPEDPAIGGESEERGDILGWERKHSERAIWVFEEGILEIIIESERGSKIDEVKPGEEESWGEATEGEPEGASPLPRGVSEEGIEAEGDDGTGGDIIGDDGEGDGEASEEGVGGFGA